MEDKLFWTEAHKQAKAILVSVRMLRQELERSNFFAAQHLFRRLYEPMQKLEKAFVGKTIAFGSVSKDAVIAARRFFTLSFVGWSRVLLAIQEKDNPLRFVSEWEEALDATVKLFLQEAQNEVSSNN